MVSLATLMNPQAISSVDISDETWRLISEASFSKADREASTSRAVYTSGFLHKADMQEQCKPTLVFGFTKYLWEMIRE